MGSCAPLDTHDFEHSNELTRPLSLRLRCRVGEPRCLRRNPPTRRPQADTFLRAALYMAAVVATQYNPDIRRLYQRLIAGGKMSALGAAMRTASATNKSLCVRLANGDWTTTDRLA